MTQAVLSFEPEPTTLVERLAAYFQRRANTWVDGLELAKVAGSYAWRSRCSDLRKPPFGMTIENRVRTVRSLTGKAYRVSEYRLVTLDSNAILSVQEKRAAGGEA